MNIIVALKAICWYVTILFLQTNLVNTIHNRHIPAINFIWQAIGITGLIILYFEIGG